MKKLFILWVCTMLLTGCQKPSVLPSGISGTWKTQDSPWQIVVSPEGTVSSAIIPLAGVEVKPNRTSKVEGRGGEPGVFEAGDFDIGYSPETRELTVLIEIKHIYLDMGDILTGTCNYFIVGELSKDSRTWNAGVLTLLDTVVLSRDPNALEDSSALRQVGTLQTSQDDPLESITFTKVENTVHKR